jgi:hypothetical protein
MTTRNAGLLLSDAAQPATGISKTTIVQWYGGDLTLIATGAFDGATIEVMACARFPHTGDRAEYADGSKFSDADFSPIATLTEPGTTEYGNVNPCALAVKVTSPGANTRAKVVAA